MGAIDSGNTAWILTSASLVFLMTPGVAFFYGGMVRAKAVLNMLMLEAAALSVTMIIWTLWGWSIAYAGSDIGGIFGDPASGFLLKDSMVAQDGVFTATGLNGNNYPVSVDVAFQVAFAMITVGLICGAIAERVKYSTWMIFVALWVTFDYAPMAHMVWNGGLLSADGAISKAIGAAAHDFAGGTVVHINAAVAALIIVLIIGKRKGFGTQPFRPHNVPFVMLGAFLLWFGWFGFNAGSALGANGLAANAFVTTQAAAAAATVSWVLVEWYRNGKPTILGAASGCIAGLVAITPAAGFVKPMPALAIGLIGGIVCYFAVAVLKEKLGYDDSLDAFGVHGIGGTWGSIATGLWATTEVNPAGADGLFYGETHLLFAQVVSVIVAYALAIVGTYILFKIVSHFMKVRADETEEIAGLDVVEHGERGYASAMMAGSPIAASLENSSEMLANTILSTQKE